MIWDPEGGTHALSDQAARRASASRHRGEGSGRGNSPAVRSGRQANVSEPAARQGIRKGELTYCQIRPPGERQRAGRVARDPEGGTHILSDQAARRTLASRQRGEGSGKGNSQAVRSGRQANVNELARRRGIREGELTRCQIRPPGERQRAGSAARVPEGRTHRLSDQAARRTLASRQRGKGSGRANSLTVRSGRQANVSAPAGWRGIRKGELTSCQIRPQGEG